WERRDSFVHQARRDVSKFRCFLSQVLIRFLQDQVRTEATIRAGGKVEHVSVEVIVESGQSLPGSVQDESAHSFHLEFARTIIQLATRNLTYADHHLAILKGQKQHAQAAKELGISDGAFRVAHFRFRQRFGEAIREEIRNVVGCDENEVNEEIRYLMTLLERF